MGPVQLIAVTQDNACNFTRIIIIIIIFKTEAASNYTEHIRRTGNSCHFPTFCCSHISKHSGWRPVHDQNVCGGLSMTCTMVAFKPRIFHIQLVFSNKHNKMELICSLWLNEVKLAISCKLFVMIRWLTVMNWRKLKICCCLLTFGVQSEPHRCEIPWLTFIFEYD